MSLTNTEIFDMIDCNDTEINYSEQCNVCLDSIDESNTVTLKCGHKYHYDCILNTYKMFSSKKRECPYCRNSSGLLELKKGYKFIPNIHKEVSNTKCNNDFEQKVEQKFEQNLKIATKKKCSAILANGINKGKKCKNTGKNKINGIYYCGIHAVRHMKNI